MNRVISDVKNEKLVDNDCLEALRNGWKKRSSLSHLLRVDSSLPCIAFVLRDQAETPNTFLCFFLSLSQFSASYA